MIETGQEPTSVSIYFYFRSFSLKTLGVLEKLWENGMAMGWVQVCSWDGPIKTGKELRRS